MTTHTTRPQAPLISLRILLATFAAVTALNFGAVFYGLTALRGLLPQVHYYTYTGDAFPAQLPLKLSLAGLILQTGKPHFSLEADNDWDMLLPSTNGSKGIVALGPHNRTFLISMAHQFHCLNSIRLSFLANQTGATEHVEHCLRYLRQMVLCYADATLDMDEPDYSSDGILHHGSSGLGSLHRCRDWTALRDFMDEYAAVAQSI